jgi:hypothetical protein
MAIVPPGQNRVSLIPTLASSALYVNDGDGGSLRQQSIRAARSQEK